MPDIRTTPQLSDFAGPAEIPLSEGGNWDQAATDGDYVHPLELAIDVGGNHKAAGHIGLFGGKVNWTSYWTPITASGDVEVWGRATHLEISQRLGLALWAGAGGAFSGITGYLVQMMQTDNFGNGAVFLYRQDGGSESLLDSAGNSDGFLQTGGLYLLRTRDSDIEFWYSLDNGDTWTMPDPFPVSDNNYRTDFRLVLNTYTWLTDSGWYGVGGGEPRVDWPQEFIRRPWRYQGLPINTQIP